MAMAASTSLSTTGLEALTPTANLLRHSRPSSGSIAPTTSSSSCCCSSSPGSITGSSFLALSLSSRRSFESASPSFGSLKTSASPQSLHSRHRRSLHRLNTRASADGSDGGKDRSSSSGQSSPSTSGSGFGLGGPGSWFGFGNKQEREVGRLAMMGFAAGVVMEVVTGKGVVAQLGFDPLAVRWPLLAGLAFLTVGGLVGGYSVIQNPPDYEKVPANEGVGKPRDPLKTFDPTTADPLTMYTRGKPGQEPYASDLETGSKKK